MEPIIDIIEVPIAVEAFRRRMASNAGAIVEFSGIVRDTEDGQPASSAILRGIDYESFHEMALAELGRIARDVIERYELTDLVCVHRIGFVPAHEAAVYVCTAARHRREAYDANIEFIEQLKRRVPIWKHPRYLERGD